MTREQWLEAAVEKLRPYFEDHQHDLPDTIRVSCGWPSRGAVSSSNRRLGECWKPEAAKDGVSQIFVSPFVSDPLRVLDILVHELIHAVYPDAKHGKVFADAAKDLGLVGKATETVAGEELTERLKLLVEELGEYNNASLDKLISSDSPKPQKNRQLKIKCPKTGDHEEYILRGSNKTLDLGLPNCPLCGTTLAREENEEEES